MRPSSTATHRITWRGVTCTVTHTRNHINEGWSLLDVRVIAPKGAPLPITTTGHRTRGLDEDEVVAAGGAVAFVTAWMDAESVNPGYAYAVAHWKQLDLFARD
jgi:hypothetical protein